MERKGLFSHYKYCGYCRRPLPNSYPDDLCPACQEQVLFQQVKEYIRTNDVTEYDVASTFDIPLSLVKDWIREGRIEYKEEKLNQVITMHCQICGAQIRFGTLCSKCLKLKNMVGHGISGISSAAANRMRFFDEGGS